jgi:glutamate mutase epsilon subunit
VTDNPRYDKSADINYVDENESSRGDIMDALDYPEELEPVYRAYHDLRHEWERRQAAFRLVVNDVIKREAMLRMKGEKPW